MGTILGFSAERYVNKFLFTVFCMWLGDENKLSDLNQCLSNQPIEIKNTS